MEKAVDMGCLFEKVGRIVSVLRFDEKLSEVVGLLVPKQPIDLDTDGGCLGTSSPTWSLGDRPLPWTKWAKAILGGGLSRDPHSYGGARRAATKGSIGFQPVAYGSDTGKMPVLLFLNGRSEIDRYHG